MLRRYLLKSDFVRVLKIPLAFWLKLNVLHGAPKYFLKKKKLTFKT